MKKTLLIRQRDSTDCGAACIASVCAHYNLKVRVSQVRLRAGTGKYGTSVFGLIQAATHFRFVAKAIRVPYGSLNEIPFPAIAHVQIHERFNHFMVIVRVTLNKIVLMDPAKGKLIRLSHNEFKKIWKGVAVVMIPGEEFINGKYVSNYRRFRQLARPHLTSMAFAFGIAVAMGMSGFFISLYVKKIVDTNWMPEKMTLLDSISVVSILVAVFHWSLEIARNLLTLKTGRDIDKNLVTAYYHHLLNLPQRFFDNMRVGEIIGRVNDAVKISNFINEVAVNILLNTVMAVFAFMIMFIFYWKLALVMSVSIPVYALLFYRSDKVNEKWQRQLMERSAALDAQLVESLTGAETVKRLSLEKYFVAKTGSALGSLLQDVYRCSVYQFSITGTSDFVARLFTVIILWAGSYYVMQKKMSPGELMSFYSLIGYFTTALLSLMGSVRPVRETLIAADRLFEIMDLEREHSGDVLVEEMACIRFANVCYSYGNGEKVLDDVSFAIKKGSITGIAGESGSGKSTISALLQKLYLPSSGSIILNNTDICSIDNTSLRKTIVSVPQHTHLFLATIAENIAIGYAEPDMAKITDLAGRLGILEFVERLPEGFHTMLHEQGSNLSGGQKQKLSIARALYKEPSVLIMDEGTSSLDHASEKKVMQTLEWYRKKGNTVVIIAHKDSTLSICDNIVLIENGRIA